MASLKQIDIPWTGSLYEPSSDALLEKIESHVSRAKVGDIIVMRANADCHDYSNSWLHYLRHDAIWHELMGRLSRWHIVMAQIYYSKAKWFFLADGDVVGSWWEFACAFQGRIVTNPYAKIGFPEIFIDLFPPLGVLGIRKFKAYDGPTLIRRNAILHAKDAFKVGLVDLCLLSDDWTKPGGVEHLKDWFEKRTGDNDVKPASLQTYIKGAGQIDAVETARADARTRRQWLEVARLESAFDAIRDKSPQAKAARLLEVRAAAATRFLMTDYAAWLSRRVARYRLGLHDRWWSIASDLIAIDISDGLPPQEIVKTFLLRRKKIVFISGQPEKMRSGLEMIRSQFDRNDVDGRNAYFIWDQAVSWVCPPKESSYKGIVCEFHWDGTLTVQSRGGCFRYLRISGNHSLAGKGWYEDLNFSAPDEHANSEAEEVFETIALIANGILKGRKGFQAADGKGPMVGITTAIRFVFLEYLLSLSDRMPRGKTFLDVLKMLSTSGWGFASDPYQWEALLKTYKPLQMILKESFASFTGSPKIWKLEQVSGILEHKISYSLPSSHDLDLRSGASVTRYLEMFCHALGKWLCENEYVSTSNEADLFITLSTGYPGLLPLPQRLEEDLGKSRVAYWLDSSLKVFS